jgi:hypothetical protein
VKHDRTQVRLKQLAQQNRRPDEVAARREASRDKRHQSRQHGPFVAAAIYDPVTQETIQASLYDTSLSDVGLVAEQLLPRGRELTLLVDSQRVKMLVRNCTRRNSRWVAGCEFTEPLPSDVAATLGLSLN